MTEKLSSLFLKHRIVQGATLEYFNLYAPSLAILSLLKEGDEYCIKELGEASFLTMSSLSKMLTEMELGNLIVREVGRVDSRKLMVSITDNGLEAYQRCLSSIEDEVFDVSEIIEIVRRWQEISEITRAHHMTTTQLSLLLTASDFGNHPFSIQELSSRGYLGRTTVSMAIPLLRKRGYLEELTNLDAVVNNSKFEGEETGCFDKRVRRHTITPEGKALLESITNSVFSEE